MLTPPRGAHDAAAGLGAADATTAASFAWNASFLPPTSTGPAVDDTCYPRPEDVLWDDPILLAQLAVLAVINVMVIVGNCLVIAAVFMSSKLRSVTNLFIVSLAVADLMVGVAVLPFSATWEVFKVWIFGDVWCSIWLAVDVWMCTASILNLCAISLDRYVAVTRPVTYPSIMSSKRAKILIAGVWVLSFVICFPPLVGWKDDGAPSTSANATADGVPPPPPSPPPPCPWTCELTNDAGYVVYSALGSFYIPMFVMLFFYWRIYRAAVSTTRAINQGFRTTKGARGGAFGNRFDEQRLTLRIHRGRGSVMTHGSGGSNSTATSTAGSPSLSSGRSPSARRLERSRTHDKIKISVSYPSSDAICASAAGGGRGGVDIPPPSSPSPNSSKKSSFSSSPPGSVTQYSVHYQNSTSPNANSAATLATTTLTTSPSFRSRGDGNASGGGSNCHLRVTGLSRLSSIRRSGRRRSSTDSTVPPPTPGIDSGPKELSPSPTFDEGSANKPKLISRMGKRNIKAQVKRFRMETKAAKTLGIIVGGFIFCWLPFFTMYVVRAFCVPCIHPVVFSVLFWLGYCNSAINPCIYALFSKDFRFAFKRIICRCFCNRGAARTRSGRRGSDGSQLGALRSGGGTERGRSPSYTPGTGCGGGHGNGAEACLGGGGGASGGGGGGGGGRRRGGGGGGGDCGQCSNSVGDDSDPGNEGSDSR